LNANRNKILLKSEKVTEMVKENLKCFHCKTLNCRDVSKQNPNVIIYCSNCGFAQNPDPAQLAKLDDPHPENWLECLPLKGVVAREPLGETPDGYTDPVNGDAHSLEEYKSTFFIDPEIYLDYVKRKNPSNVPGFECKEPVVPVQKPPSTDDDPVKLKQDQLAGRIDQVVYLEKLKSFR